MINKTYRQVLLEAWRITIKNPILWLFGLLAVFSLNTGIFEGSVQNISKLISSNSIKVDAGFSLDIYNISLNKIFNTALPNNQNFFSLVLLISVIILFIYITTIAQIALVKKVNIFILKKKNITNEKLLHESNESFGSVLVINILSRISFSLLFLISAIPLLLSLVNNNPNALALSTIIFFIIFIPLSIVLSLVTIFSIIYSILEKEDVIKSIKKAWDIVRNNFLLSVEILLSLLIIKLFAILLVLLFTSIIFIPIAIFISTLLVVNKIIIFSLFLIIASIVAVVVFGGLAALFATYYITTLTILFEDLTSYNLTSKTIRLYNSIISSIKLTKEQKNKIKQIAEKNNITSRDIITTINKTLNKYKPKINKVIKDASKKYEDLEPTLTSTKLSLKKILEEETKKLIPTLKRVEKNVKSDSKLAYTNAKPKIKKVAKKIEKEYPHLVKIKNQLEEKYRADLEKELSKVFIKTKKPVSKKSINRKPKKKA